MSRRTIAQKRIASAERQRRKHAAAMTIPMLGRGGSKYLRLSQRAMGEKLYRWLGQPVRTEQT